MLRSSFSVEWSGCSIFNEVNMNEYNGAVSNYQFA